MNAQRPNPSASRPRAQPAPRRTASPPAAAAPPSESGGLRTWLGAMTFIAAGALLLYTVRVPMATWIDAHVPRVGGPGIAADAAPIDDALLDPSSDDPSAPLADADGDAPAQTDGAGIGADDLTPASDAVVAADGAAAPTPIPLSYYEVRVLLEPLPDQILVLIADGEKELPAFVDLDADDPIRVRQMRNRWRSWGRIWNNRVGVIAALMPPRDACARHAGLNDLCASLGEAFADLYGVRHRTSLPVVRADFARAEMLVERVQAALEADAAGDADR
ncbi:MAG: hypothetical protein AAF772_08155 [Acidobacteriota bacterium]